MEAKEENPYEKLCSPLSLRSPPCRGEEIDFFIVPFPLEGDLKPNFSFKDVKIDLLSRLFESSFSISECFRFTGICLLKQPADEFSMSKSFVLAFAP